MNLILLLLTFAFSLFAQERHPWCGSDPLNYCPSKKVYETEKKIKELNEKLTLHPELEKLKIQIHELQLKLPPALIKEGCYHLPYNSPILTGSKVCGQTPVELIGQYCDEGVNFEAQRNAIVSYLGQGYGPINRGLRRLEKISPKVLREIQALDEAIEHAPPLPCSQEVYRGVIYNNDFPMPKVGDEIEELGFMSTTLTKASAEYFVDNRSQAQTMSFVKAILIIQLPKGQKGIYIPYTQKDFHIFSEDEFLLPRGIKLRIQEMQKIRGVFYLKAHIL